MYIERHGTQRSVARRIACVSDDLFYRSAALCLLPSAICIRPAAFRRTVHAVRNSFYSPGRVLTLISLLALSSVAAATHCFDALTKTSHGPIYSRINAASFKRRRLSRRLLIGLVHVFQLFIGIVPRYTPTRFVHAARLFLHAKLRDHTVTL